MYEELNRTIIVDIETDTHGKAPNPEKDDLKYCGIRLPNGNKLIYSEKQTDAIQRTLNRFKYVVGHNFRDYDKPILERFGVTFYNNIIIDTYKIVDKRFKVMLYIDLYNKSLRNVAQYLKLPCQKGDFDYTKLSRRLSNDEYQELVTYLNGDLDTTYELFKWLYKMFYGLKEYMNREDQQTMKWLTSSSGVTCAKIIHNARGTTFKIDNIKERESYDGAYIWSADKDAFHGKIYCNDWASLYPHMMIGLNVFNRNKDNIGYHGRNVYKSFEEDNVDGLKGYYEPTRGKVEEFLVSLFKKRKSIKKEMKLLDKKSDEYQFLDSQQLACKIILNSSYGILGNPIFHGIYDNICAGDVTAMARTTNKYTSNKLKEIGCDVVYMHTDSIYYLADNVDDKLIETTIKNAVKEQIESMNCPIETHNFEREHSIKHMYLFRDSSGNVLKARNLYFTTDDKVHFTGIKPSKNTTSALALKVFNDKICPMLNSNKPNPYFDIKQLYLWIREYALQDISLITKQYRVKHLGEYKTFSSVQAQISKMYGAGEHHLVTNHYIGAGKGIKVCKIEELMKVFGDNWIDAIDLNSYLSDLNEFILPAYRNLISKLKYENGELIYKTRSVINKL